MDWNKIRKWEDCGREDLKMIPTMISKGWTPKFSESDTRYNRLFPPDVPHDGVSFTKGNKTCWEVQEWIVADIINNRYQNHRKYQSLDEILINE